ncbi:MAG: NTP transferase domain-containing protein [Acidobacteria bacterium]|nr:NTP transferase domain-containing protein [Acidobacteriota bacterium]
MSVKTALILAAGNGTRLQSSLQQIPKPLIPVGGVPLLRRVVLGAQHAGIHRFVIVIGHLGQVVQGYFAQHPVTGVSLQWVKNEEYEKANGMSVLKARRELQEPFLLLMSDHLFDPNTAQALLRQPLLDGEVILGVDRKLDRIFDIEDATKVRLSGDRITDIGKVLTDYDAVDTGMFLCHPVLFDALQASVIDGDCALSDGIRYLARRDHMRAFDIGDALWLDVDTPEAVRYAETFLRDRLKSETASAPVAKQASGVSNLIR